MNLRAQNARIKKYKRYTCIHIKSYLKYDVPRFIIIITQLAKLVQLVQLIK